MSAVARFDESKSSLPPDIIQMLKSLKDELLKIENISSIVLFGSYSKGTYDKDSDIDIAVFVGDSAAANLQSIYRQAVRCTAEYKYDIQILIFTDASLISPMGIVEEIVTYGQEITFV